MSKYINENHLGIADIKHDITGLKGPLAFVLELMMKQNFEKALLIQKEILKKIELIEAELSLLPTNAIVIGEDLNESP